MSWCRHLLRTNPSVLHVLVPARLCPSEEENGVGEKIFSKAAEQLLSLCCDAPLGCLRTTKNRTDRMTRPGPSSPPPTDASAARPRSGPSLGSCAPVRSPQPRPRLGRAATAPGHRSRWFHGRRNGGVGGRAELGGVADGGARDLVPVAGPRM